MDTYHIIVICVCFFYLHFLKLVYQKIYAFCDTIYIEEDIYRRENLFMKIDKDDLIKIIFEIVSFSFLFVWAIGLNYLAYVK